MQRVFLVNNNYMHRCEAIVFFSKYVKMIEAASKKEDPTSAEWV